MVFYTKKEASKFLRLSARSISRYIKDPISHIPYSYIGNNLRFHKQDLIVWLQFKKLISKSGRMYKKYNMH